MEILSKKAEQVHATLRQARGECAVWARTGVDVLNVYEIDGIGRVSIECKGETVQRARGEKLRLRYSFRLNGMKIAEKDLYAKARAL